MHGQSHALGSEDFSTRRNALRSLVRRGPIAVKALGGLLTSPHEHVRWEAAKALGRIGRPEAAERLASALDDESLDVRWLASDGFISIGDAALVPLLRMLIKSSNSVRVREAATHTLHAFLDEKHHTIIAPVLSALQLGTPIENVPVAAYDALNELKALQRKQSLQLL